jgi:hypothetical protein
MVPPNIAATSEAPTHQPQSSQRRLLSPFNFSIPQFASGDEEWHLIGFVNHFDLPLGINCVF